MTLTTDDYESVARELEAVVSDEVRESFRASYNVAPSDRHWIVYGEDGERRLRGATWGWHRDDGGLLVNARSENVERSPNYRVPFLQTRCIVVADGFYEWSGPRQARQAWWIHPSEGGLLLLAGLFLDGLDPETRRPERRFTVLTTAPNQDLAAVHTRMPAIIPRARLDGWLSSGTEHELRSQLRPLTDGILAVRPVSDHVNRPDHDDPTCIDPIPTPPVQGWLFDDL